MKKYLLIFLLLISCTSGGVYRFKFDDDILKPTKNNDKHYTDGFQLSSEISDSSGSHEYYGGQLNYTPGKKQLIEPQPDDRPYASLAYVGYKAHYIEENQQTTYGLQIGLIGPHAYGEQVQNEFHRLIGDLTVKGWGNQLHDEPQLMGILERQYRFPVKTSFDITNTIGGNLGTPYTQAYIGSLARFGHNLPLSFNATSPIFPRIPFQSPKTHFTAYGFGGPFGRVVGRNVFLDGNTFRNSQSVDKNLAVVEGRLGVAVEYNKYRFTYAYFLLSKEFENQDKKFDFGEVNFGVVW